MSKNHRANISVKRKPFPIRLQQSIKACEKYSKPMKNNRQIILQRYASGYYNAISYPQQLYALNTKARPINMIFRYITIMMPFLAQHMPKTFVSPKGNDLYMQTAEMLSKALTHLKGEIEYREAFRAAVLDAIMYLGAIKIGMCPGSDIEWGGHTHQAGQVYADVIDPDDLIFDVGARRASDLFYIGNKYRLPLNYIRKSGLFKNFEKLKPLTKVFSNESPEAIAKSEVSDTEYQEIYEMAEVYDVYMADTGVLLTLPAEDQGEKFLRKVEFLPEGGPYELLAFHNFPGSVLPIPPAYNALDLDEAINRLARRLDAQVKGQKSFMAYEAGAEEDMQKINLVKDTGSVKVLDISKIKEINLGTPQQDSIAVAQWYINQFSEQQGNLNTLGGVKSEAKTLGQEKMLATQAQGPVEDMYNSVHAFAKRVERKMAWYLMADPFIQIPMIKEIPGVKGGLSLIYDNQTRDGDFLDYNFEIEPYSMQGKTPQEAYQQLLSAINQVVIPFLEPAAQQGMTVDVQRVISATSKYIESDDLAKILVPMDKEMQIPENPGPYPQPLQGQNMKKPKNAGGQLDGRLGAQEDPGAVENAKQRNEKQESQNATV